MGDIDWVAGELREATTLMADRIDQRRNAGHP
jgi:hypothetical protein